MWLLHTYFHAVWWVVITALTGLWTAFSFHCEFVIGISQTENSRPCLLFTYGALSIGDPFEAAMSVFHHFVPSLSPGWTRCYGFPHSTGLSAPGVPRGSKTQDVCPVCCQEISQSLAVGMLGGQPPLPRLNFFGLHNHGLMFVLSFLLF